MPRMKKRRNKTRNRQGLQVVTLCISTAMVLILLGLAVFSVLTMQRLSSYVRENIVVTMMLDNDMTTPEAQQFCKKLNTRPYVNRLEYVSKEQALKEGTALLGLDPSEFTDGVNPYLPSVELTLKADYANNDSLRWIAQELKTHPHVGSIRYEKNMIDDVNRNLGIISLVMLGLAVLLTIISFALINNSVRLGIYARRFTIHTMKLVGASWGFIRRPFLRRSLLIGLVASMLACLVLAGLLYALRYWEVEVLSFLSWQVLAVTFGTVFLFGLLITLFCTWVSVNKFLRMTAGELYKI